MKNTNDTELKVNHMFKARLFEMVFSRREELLQLYNAINGTDYQNPEELEINTLQNAIYMSMHLSLIHICPSMKKRWKCFQKNVSIKVSFRV